MDKVKHQKHLKRGSEGVQTPHLSNVVFEDRRLYLRIFVTLRRSFGVPARGLRFVPRNAASASLEKSSKPILRISVASIGRFFVPFRRLVFVFGQGNAVKIHTGQVALRLWAITIRRCLRPFQSSATDRSNKQASRWTHQKVENERANKQVTDGCG